MHWRKTPAAAASELADMLDQESRGLYLGSHGVKPHPTQPSEMTPLMLREQELVRILSERLAERDSDAAELCADLILMPLFRIRLEGIPVTAYHYSPIQSGIVARLVKGEHVSSEELQIIEPGSQHAESERKRIQEKIQIIVGELKIFSDLFPEGTYVLEKAYQQAQTQAAMKYLSQMEKGAPKPTGAEAGPSQGGNDIKPTVSGTAPAALSRGEPKPLDELLRLAGLRGPNAKVKPMGMLLATLRGGGDSWQNVKALCGGRAGKAHTDTTKRLRKLQDNHLAEKQPTGNGWRLGSAAYPNKGAKKGETKPVPVSPSTGMGK